MFQDIYTFIWKTYRGSFSGGCCGGGGGCCCGGNDDILTLLALAAAVMFLMMQMGGGRRKRSIDEEEGYVSSTIDRGKGIQYTLEVNVLTQQNITLKTSNSK